MLVSEWASPTAARSLGPPESQHPSLYSGANTPRCLVCSHSGMMSPSPSFPGLDLGLQGGLIHGWLPQGS